MVSVKGLSRVRLGGTAVHYSLVVLALVVALAAPGWAHVDGLVHPELPTCAPGDPRLLLPDLVPDPPSKDRTTRRNGRRILQFTTAVANVGDGPLIVEGKTVQAAEGEITAAWQLIERRGTGRCARFAGSFEFHPSHRHWHFERFVAYELRRDDPHIGPFAAEGSKASFCLLDLDIVRGLPTFPVRQLSQLTCDSQEGTQGISVGWKDVYDRTLDEQFIDLDFDDPVPAGSYYLVNAVDPDGLLWEKDTTNNVSFIRTSIALAAPASPVDRPAPVPTPDLSTRPEPISNDDRPGRPPRQARPPRAPRPTAAPQPTRAAQPTRPPQPTRAPRPGNSAPIRTPAEVVPPTPVAPQPPATQAPIPQPPATQAPAPQPPAPQPTQAPAPPPPATQAPAPPATQPAVVPTQVPAQPPTQAPTQAPTVPPTPTLAPPPPDPSFSMCANACRYEFSQARFNWRDMGGLDLSFSVRGRNCPDLDFRSGDAGAVFFSNWITTRGEDTGKFYSSTFRLDGLSAATSDAGQISMSPVAGGTQRVSYRAPVPPIAGPADGANFPVAFDLCMVVGDKAVTTRLVCQPKPDGALCHQG